MNPRDKMPLELTPIFYKLQRYDATKLNPPVVPAVVPVAPAPDTTPTASPDAASAPPQDTGTSNPPQQ
jgi:hypothetical protein